MKHPSHVPSARRVRHRTLSIATTAALTATGLLALAGSVSAAPERLQTADGFAVLAGSTITNSGVSTVDGDVGLHPGTAVTGLEPCTGPANCLVHSGTQHVDDEVAAQAQADLLAGYDQLVGLEDTCTSIEVELGGRLTPLTPGVYCSPTFELTGTLTLDGAGEYVFLTGAGGSTLTTAAGSQVLLVNGADACDVYWQVASSATLGAASSFAGRVMAQASISFDAAAELEGSALAMNGAVTLIANTITNTGCTPDDTTPDDGDGDGAPVVPDATDTSTGTPATATTTTTTGTTTAGSGGPAGPPGATTSQVTRVPSGSVSAGGGGVQRGSAYPALLVAAVAVAAGAWRRHDTR